MRIMNGWTIDWTDVAIGVGMLLALIVVGITLRVARQIAQFDLAVDESRECFCDGSCHEPEPQQCADCGRYVELGVGD